MLTPDEKNRPKEQCFTKSEPGISGEDAFMLYIAEGGEAGAAWCSDRWL